MNFRKAWANWQLHGVPRCYALLETGLCRRLMWPWQEWDGDGESAYHAVCLVRQRTYLDRTELDVWPPARSWT